MSGNAVKTPPGRSGGPEGQTRGPGGGIGGVAPDGGNSGHLFTVKYAGEIFNHPCPASRHEKQDYVDNSITGIISALSENPSLRLSLA